MEEFTGRFLKLNENKWKDIFSELIYFGPYGIRMPLNDRISEGKPEKRPFAPYRLLRFHFIDPS